MLTGAVTWGNLGDDEVFSDCCRYKSIFISFVFIEKTNEEHRVFLYVQVFTSLPCLTPAVLGCRVLMGELGQHSPGAHRVVWVLVSGLVPSCDLL